MGQVGAKILQVGAKWDPSRDQVRAKLGQVWTKLGQLVTNISPWDKLGLTFHMWPHLAIIWSRKPPATLPKLKCPRALREHLAVLLLKHQSWFHYDPKTARLGPKLDQLGAKFGQVEVKLDSKWPKLGPSWNQVGPSWRQVGFYVCVFVCLVCVF